MTLTEEQKVLFDALTALQKRFVTHLLNGANQTEAYRKAGGRAKGDGAVVLAMVAIHACSGESNSTPVALTATQYSQPQQQSQPVVVQPQQPVVVHDDGNSGFLSGLMMGHLLSGGGGNSGVSHYHSHTTVVHKSYASPRTYSRTRTIAYRSSRRR